MLIALNDLDVVTPFFCFLSILSLKGAYHTLFTWLQVLFVLENYVIYCVLLENYVIYYVLLENYVIYCLFLYRFIYHIGCTM